MKALRMKTDAHKKRRKRRIKCAKKVKKQSKPGKLKFLEPVAKVRGSNCFRMVWGEANVAKTKILRIIMLNKTKYCKILLPKKHNTQQLTKIHKGK